MFKWFWTTFSLGAPESGLQEIRHRVLTINFLNMIIYFFHFTNQAFPGDRELKRRDSNPGGGGTP